MELLTLRTFQAVVETGGVLAASRKLNTVQSNVTTRIKRLEEELSSALFIRHGRSLELSPAGRVLLPYVARMLQLEKQTVAAVQQVGQNAGELRLGAMETFAAVHLPEVLIRLRTAHHGLKLNIQTNTSVRLIEQVAAFKLDCAFIAGTVEHPDLRAQQVLQEELVLVRSRAMAEANQTLILFREGCAYRARALAWRRQRGQQSSEAMELGTLEGILGCVAVGLGETLLPRQVARMSRYSDVLIVEALPEAIALIPTMMITHKEGVTLPCLETLSHVVASYLATPGFG